MTVVNVIYERRLNRILDADVEVGDILRQPYDLVSREENSRFFEIISRYGKVLYG